MLLPLTCLMTCLGLAVHSEANGLLTLQNQEGRFGNFLNDVPQAEGSGAVDVAEALKTPYKVPKRQAEVDTCTAEYAAVSGHTMCMDDNPEVTSHGVSDSELQDIVKLHNKLRGNVKPAATDLAKLIWDDRLAMVADKWARQCLMEHDEVRNIPEYGLPIGQNVAGGYGDWHTAIMGWYNEVTLYRYGQDKRRYPGRDGWKKIGHYTQIVQNVTYLVGCGFADCVNSKFGRYYVCNYASGQSNIAYPYTRGERCSDCPHTCVDGVCDCGGKVCLNGGSIDLNTCKCSCSPLYGGPTCSQLSCPTRDAFYCGRSLSRGDCKRYYNVPQLCPYMCGVCESDASSATTPDDPSPKQSGSRPSQSRPRPGQSRPRPSQSRTGQSQSRVRIVKPYRPVRPTRPTPSFTSEHGCVYSGKRSSKAECRRYGDHGNDMPMCASMGGSQVTCDHCQKFYNIKTDYCPVMCGICDPPCRGKKCLNGGKLNTSSCKCTCKAPYEGDTCATAACPPRDPAHCVLYKAEYCNRFINVPSECPFMCGIC